MAKPWAEATMLVRHRPPVAITTIPRSTLTTARHKDIDTILKDLKLCSRSLSVVLDGLKDELRILERLYYKSKNQHRMSLFFKRVHELRRYGRRLSELGVLERVDLLRASFVGLDHTNDHRALRGPWNHVPEKPYVDFVTERLTACSTLACKIRERLENAYRHFALAMQTGAFVQLIILFAAVSSRMSVLSSELQNALLLGISTCQRLLVIVDPTGQQLPSEPALSCPSHVGYDVPLEDTGQMLSCHEPNDSSTVVVKDLKMRTDVTPEIPLTPAPNGDDRVMAQRRGKATAKVVQKSRAKKAKKKLDEIDEIFGF